MLCNPKDVRESLAWIRPHGLDSLKYIELTDRVEKIIAESDVSIRGADGTGEPVVSPYLIAINGDANLGEKGMAFEFPRIIPERGMIQMDDGDQYFDLVGTSFYPYRDVVIDILTAAKEIFGNELEILDATGCMTKHIYRTDSVKTEQDTAIPA